MCNGPERAKRYGILRVYKKRTQKWYNEQKGKGKK